MIVLVGYATEHGSTQGVAQRIGERLRQHGLAVDVRSMAEVEDLTPYGMAVLGSAIHGGRWLTDGNEFVRRHTPRLRDLPVWFFSVSTLGDEDSMFPPGVASRLRRLRKDTPEITAFRETVGPREHCNFTGAIARDDWPTPGRLAFRAMGGRYGDHRNWPAIDAWAEHIALEASTTVSF